MATEAIVRNRWLGRFGGRRPSTIDSWVSQKREIPYVKMGRRVLFDTNDVERWIEKNKVQPTDFGNLH
ncbi:MAG: helix-turn-helix domain-containing protein [candidate division Zixibacteria bacterium]